LSTARSREVPNLQPFRTQAKRYRIEQMLDMIEQDDLPLEGDE
jgi:hypothetical protein